MTRQKPKPAPTPTSDRILAAIRAHTGAELSKNACAIRLAAEAAISIASAQKALSGRQVRPDIAQRIADTLAVWGASVRPGDIAMGAAP